MAYFYVELGIFKSGKLDVHGSLVMSNSVNNNNIYIIQLSFVFYSARASEIISVIM